jgi:DHA2 family multidrug resistance protein
MSALTLSASSQIPKSAAPVAPANPDRASATVWIAILAAMIGAFMAILNIQITNASLSTAPGSRRRI